jgi:hypothetical protein
LGEDEKKRKGFGGCLFLISLTLLTWLKWTQVKNEVEGGFFLFFLFVPVGGFFV